MAAWQYEPIQASRHKKRRIRYYWSCSEFVRHEHRWKWTAWLCGRWQLLREE